MKYDFDQIIDRRPSGCLKWNTYDADVLPLWVADMDFKSPQPVIEALHGLVDHGFFGYPDGLLALPNQVSELREAIVAWLQQRHGWKIDPEWLVFVPGVVTGFNLAGKLAQSDQAVLIQTPVYPPIVTMAEDTGIQGQAIELMRDARGEYQIDWERFEAAFTPQTRLLLLCNPHNPIGKVYSADELRRIAEICIQRGVTIISDEIHCDLVFSESRHTPIASLSAEIAAHSITLMAPSKTFNLAGLQCSFAIIPDAELRKWYSRSRGHLVPWVTQFALTGALAAYRDGGEWLNQLLPYLQANRDFLYDTTRQYLPGIEMGLPKATYLAWLDCSGVGLSPDPYQFFLKKARVALGNGDMFGKGGQGFVRLNFGCPRAMLVDALERMRGALAEARLSSPDPAGS